MRGSEPLSEGDLGQTASRARPTIGQALGRRRDELALSREVAAEVVGVSRSTYAAYESDQRRLSPEVLRTLATFLSVELDEILDLYGATCVAQARRVLFGESLTETMGVARAAMRRTSRGDDMAIVERVYFDADSRDVVAPKVREQRAALPDSSSVVLEGGVVKKKKQQRIQMKDKKIKNHEKSHSPKAQSHASKKELKRAKSKKDKSRRDKFKRGD